MKFDELLKLVQSLFTTYVQTFVDLASAAILRLPEAKLKGLLKNKKNLFGFVVLNLIVGATLGRVRIDHETPAYTLEAIYVLVIWFVLVLWSHLLCRIILRGRASLAENVACTLYALSASYVVGHFAGAAVAVVQMPTGHTDPVAIVLAFAVVRSILFVLLATIMLCTANGFKLIKTGVILCLISLPLLGALFVTSDALIYAEALHKAFPGGLPGG
jgi:hypothetical protein